MDHERALGRRRPFPGDDGPAAPAEHPGARWPPRRREASPTAYLRAVAALCSDRLLVPVVATATRLGDDGRRADLGQGGRDVGGDAADAPTGAGRCSAFTGLDSLRAWRVDARPVPVTLDMAAADGPAEGVDAVLIDVAGPAPAGDRRRGAGRAGRRATAWSRPTTASSAGSCRSRDAGIAAAGDAVDPTSARDVPSAGGLRWYLGLRPIRRPRRICKRRPDLPPVRHPRDRRSGWSADRRDASAFCGVQGLRVREGPFRRLGGPDRQVRRAPIAQHIHNQLEDISAPNRESTIAFASPRSDSSDPPESR